MTKNNFSFYNNMLQWIAHKYIHLNKKAFSFDIMLTLKSPFEIYTTANLSHGSYTREGFVQPLRFSWQMSKCLDRF